MTVSRTGDHKGAEAWRGWHGAPNAAHWEFSDPRRCWVFLSAQRGTFPPSVMPSQPVLEAQHLRVQGPCRPTLRRNRSPHSSWGGECWAEENQTACVVSSSYESINFSSCSSLLFYSRNRSKSLSQTIWNEAMGVLLFSTFQYKECNSESGGP